MRKRALLQKITFRPEAYKLSYLLKCHFVLHFLSVLTIFAMKKVMLIPVSVCGFDDVFWKTGQGPINHRLDFGDNPNHSESGSQLAYFCSQ